MSAPPPSYQPRQQPHQPYPQGIFSDYNIKVLIIFIDIFFTNIHNSNSSFYSFANKIICPLIYFEYFIFVGPPPGVKGPYPAVQSTQQRKSRKP